MPAAPLVWVPYVAADGKQKPLLIMTELGPITLPQKVDHSAGCEIIDAFTMRVYNQCNMKQLLRFRRSI
jgi:hypothetical protein